jgi:hypothetical protein
MNKTLRFVIIASPLGCYKAYLAAAAIWAVESALLDEFRTMRPFTSNLVLRSVGSLENMAFHRPKVRAVCSTRVCIRI